MNLVTLLLIVLVVLAVGSAPNWGHGGWGMGYYPSGGLGLIVIILVVLLLIGRI